MKDVSIISKVVSKGGEKISYGTAQKVDLSQLKDKLDNLFFNRIFVAMDADGHEIQPNDVTTPIAYILARYNFATVGGITFHARDKSVKIETIAESLPFDDVTITYNEETNKIEVIGGTGGGTGGEGGEVQKTTEAEILAMGFTKNKGTITGVKMNGVSKGASGVVDLGTVITSHQSLSGYAKESWVLSQGYALKTDIPSLSGYALKTDIPSLSGYAKESWVLSQGYALKNDLKEYVPSSGDSDITGIKRFTKGLRGNYWDIGETNGNPHFFLAGKDTGTLALGTAEAPMTIDEKGNVEIFGSAVIDGNVTIRGGFTFYSKSGKTTPFLIDAESLDSIESTSVTQVYTARAVTVLKENLERKLEAELDKVNERLNNIKSALSGINRKSSIEEIGEALNLIYLNL